MRSLLIQFWRDEFGALLSAEAVMVGTVGVVGATVGLSSVAQSVDAELQETAFAIRSLDQSYHFTGQGSCRAWTAGSGFKQLPVAEALEQMRRSDRPEDEKAERKKGKQKREKTRDSEKSRT